jgi:hypothetical protein
LSSCQNASAGKLSATFVQAEIVALLNGKPSTRKLIRRTSLTATSPKHHGNHAPKNKDFRLSGTRLCYCSPNENKRTSNA